MRRALSGFRGWLFATIFIVVGVSISKTSAKPSPNTATTPARGWNSYDSFTWVVSEDEFKANVDAFAKLLTPFGYDTVVVDYYWYSSLAKHTYIDEYGRPQPDPTRWPSSADGSGFKKIADYVHSLGLKFGIHTMRGISGAAVNANSPVYNSSFAAEDVVLIADKCNWGMDFLSFYSLNMSHIDAQNFYDSLYQQYADWGVDFIKNDCVFGADFVPEQIIAVSKAIQKTKRNMIYSLSPGVESTVAMAQQINEYVNMYRVTGDDWDKWSDLQPHFDAADRMSSMIGAEGLNGLSFPDLDMLPFGWISNPNESGPPHRWSNLSYDEQKTQVTLWAIARSPFFYGGDLRNPDPRSIALVTNMEVLELQASSENNKAVQISGSKYHIVWRADSTIHDAVYVAVFNMLTHSGEFYVPLIDVVDEPNVTSCHVRDVWKNVNQGIVNTVISVDPLPSHGSVLYQLTNCF